VTERSSDFPLGPSDYGALALARATVLFALLGCSTSSDLLAARESGTTAGRPGAAGRGSAAGNAGVGGATASAGLSGAGDFSGGRAGSANLAGLGGMLVAGAGMNAAGGSVAGAGGSSGHGGAVGGGGAGGPVMGVAGASGASGRGGAGGGTSDGAEVTLKVFDQIPQFGIYGTRNPSYMPPAGVLMWSYGTVFLAELDATQKAALRAELAVRLTYHAQCDNYDRLGSLFFIAAPSGKVPEPSDPRIEIVRYITPFSDHTQGTLATYAYPDADVSAYASTLADTSKDVWIGITSGANPYDGDPCTDADVTPDFREVGYKFTVELVSKGAALSGPGTTLSARSYSAEKKAPIVALFENPGGALTGRVTVIVSGHGSDAGGDEYMNTHDTLTLDGAELGSFETEIDCAPYAEFSPDGNPGIFRANLGGNPRNWCPGALVTTHSFPASLKAGESTVSLAVSPDDLPSGSYYATTINFTSP
jgi:hypothetical protein